jgi:hypothetical protein
MPQDPAVSVDDMMAEVRQRVRSRLRDELARLRPDAPLLEPAAFAEVESVLREALAAREHLLIPHVLFENDDWALQRGLRFESHRRFLGRVAVGVKRTVLLPLTRWLFEYSSDNFARQARVNETLLAVVETLVVELVRLRREVETLRVRLPRGEDSSASR